MLQAEYTALTADVAQGVTPPVRIAANDLALRLRSRLIDLATWKVDYSPEYNEIEAQCRRLTEIAGTDAHPSLIREFSGTTLPGR